MTRFPLLAVCIVSFGSLCLAGPCGTGTLAGYIALGAGGCTIGGDTLYDFQVLMGTTGATAISPSNISINLSGGTYDPGIAFSTNMTASANQQLEAFFTYRIRGSYFSSTAINLANSSETADGAVTDIQNYCAGGTFGPDGVSGCTGAASGNLATDDGVQNQDSALLPYKGLLSITDDFELDGGTAGTASGGRFTDRFTSVPEPLSFLLTGLGIGLAAAWKLRRAGSGVFGK